MHHHWLSVLSVFSAVLLPNFATPPALLWGDIRVKHTWNFVPANWESLGPPPAGTTIDLHISLKPHHENALVDALYEVSDPGHQKYGAHLTKEQVAELVAPHRDTLGIVHSWLEHHDIPSSSISTSHGGGWLTISGVPVSKAEELLCASYQLYRHTGTNETEVVLRTVGYSLPAALHAHVQTVAPTTHFALPRAPLHTPHKRSGEGTAVLVNATSEALSRRDSIITPSYLRWMYQTESYVPTAMDRNALGILGFYTGFPSQTDLTQFLTDFREDAAAATLNVVELNGGNYDPSRPREDENVQTQYTAAIAYPTPQTFYSTGGFFRWELNDGRPAPNDAYLAWFDHILNGQSIPQTISVSNTNLESTLPLEYARAVCNLFMRLGARGITVLVPSGDDGVGRGDCKDRSGKAHFVPMFPASCPWVTSVGGTMGRSPEFAADFSGGGFSNHFPRPRFQAKAVPKYLKSFGLKYARLYNPRGRGIPDVSAQANGFAYIRRNFVSVASSTSCSTPTVAGIVSLLNDFLVSNGRAPLGFLNPLLYKRAFAGVNDVRFGSNPGCNTNGFVAATGWDPVGHLKPVSFFISTLIYLRFSAQVTGLGTLDFQKMLDLFTQPYFPPQPPANPTQPHVISTQTLPCDVRCTSSADLPTSMGTSITALQQK